MAVSDTDCVAVHASVTATRVYTLVEASLDGTTGICLYCGAERDGVEPDAERYPCPACGYNWVFGIEQIVLADLFAGRPLRYSQFPSRE